MSLPSIQQSLGNRPAEEKSLTLFVNRGIVPILNAARNAINQLAAELNGGRIVFGLVDPTAAPVVAGNDGDLYVRKDGLAGGQMWIMTTGVWRNIA